MPSMGLLIVACGLMAVAVPVFAILAFKQWRIELKAGESARYWTHKQSCTAMLQKLRSMPPEMID
jgi:hypothetical protein